MASALPDLGSPVAGTPGAAYHAFERQGLVIAVPDRLTLETDRHGAPQLLLSLVRQPGGGFVGGRLELGLAAEADLSGIAQSLVDAKMRAAVALADVRHAVVTVSVVLGPVGSTLLAHPQVLAGESLGVVRTVLTLDAAGATLAARLMEDATLPVNATMDLVFVAAAPRIPLALTFDPRGVVRRLAARFGEEARLTAADLGRAVDELLGTSDVVVEGDFRSVDPVLRATTLGLRFSSRMATRPPSNPAVLQLLPSKNVAQGRERLDLASREPVATDRAIVIDPLSAARAMHGGDLRDLVRRLDVEPLSTGRARVTLTANLPERIAGLQALVADLRAPEQPPFRPMEETVSVSLGEPHRSAEAELRLFSGERLSGQARLRAFVDIAGVGTDFDGRWREVQEDHVLLGVEDFPVPLFVVRASRSLLDLAVVDVTGAAIVRLDRNTPSAAVPLVNEAVPPQIVVRPLAQGREIRIDPGPTRRIDLDLALLPGFGVHQARLTTSATKPFMVEWRPDTDDAVAPSALRMGADRLAADISWVAASPFRPGLVWRTVREGVVAPWSAPVLPAHGLGVNLDGRTSVNDTQDSIVIDGITLQRKTDDRTGWTYVPRHPTLDVDSQGKPMLSIIEAGAMAFLQCTARLALREGDRAALLRKLQGVAPDARSLEAASLAVERIALEWFADGGWSTITESKGSGMPPWTAALAATLQAEAVAALKAASAGESGRARLRASITLAGSEATVHRVHEARSVRVKTTAGETRSSYAVETDASTAGRSPVPLELSADLADLLREAA